MIDPMASFEVKTLIPLKLFGIDVSITNSSLYMILVVILICVLFFIGTSDKSIIPGKLRYCLEKLFGFVNGIIDSNVSEKGSQLFPYILSLFLFIAIGNMVGLLPYAFSFTSQLVVTLCMACLVFITSIIVGIYNQGVHYLKHFCPDGIPLYIAPFFTIIELMSFAFRPVSLGIRLFANMVSGHIMIKVMASFAVSLAGTSILAGVAVIPVIVNVLLNVFKLVVCVLQAYVFAVLSCIYLSESLTTEHKEERRN
ncbi:MAG: F0F1 ATP synthase subunit A [Alphaproteobacteria bacterium]|nr:F0F1 ATP synthase subunit A [Alphaproteobacteria bacterium]